MSIVKRSIFRFGFCSVLFCCVQMTYAESKIDYNSVDVSALQGQYQRQLKPKTSKKIIIKKAAKRKQASKRLSSNLSSKDLIQYQRLLGNQEAQVRKQQAKPQFARKPAKQVQRQVQPRVQQQRIPASQPAGKPVLRRDAIFEAASSGNVRLIGQLIGQGVDVNQANNERETALHMAAAKGHYSAVIYLLNHGANINARTINNWLPIHHATRFRHLQIAHYLKQKGSQIYAKTSDGLSAVDMAKALNDRRILGVFGVR